MADVYVDLSLATGTNAGTSWANAYQGAAGFVSAAAAAAAGADVWVKGTVTTSAAIGLDFANGTANNPVRV